jgi:hypothetical protein
MATTGIPTADELEAVWKECSELNEHGLDGLIGRTSKVLVAAYEAPPAEKAEIDFGFEQLGGWYFWSESIVETCELMLANARRIQELAKNLGETAFTGGAVDAQPPFDKHGIRPYVPSREALERWGLAEAVPADG